MENSMDRGAWNVLNYSSAFLEMSLQELTSEVFLSLVHIFWSYLCWFSFLFFYSVSSTGELIKNCEICIQCNTTGQWKEWTTDTCWRRKWQPTPGFLPGKFHGQRSLVSCSLWGLKESDTTEQEEVLRIYKYLEHSQQTASIHLCVIYSRFCTTEA